MRLGDCAGRVRGGNPLVARSRVLDLLSEVGRFRKRTVCGHQELIGTTCALVHWYFALLSDQRGPAPTVLADRARLIEVFVHLLQSAAASIPSTRWDSARVNVALLTDPQGNACVRVTDDGDPIPEEALPRVFDPYAAAGGRGGGAAFRLSICHRIVTSVGGRIGVASSPSGTSVTVTLPARP